MGRNDPHFNFRMPYELRAKLKFRAQANGRSMNSELLQIVADALGQPPPIKGYRDDAERHADACSQEIRDLVFGKLNEYYRKQRPT